MYQSNRSLNISPPWAYPVHLTAVPAREGGHLITTQRVGKFIAHKFKGKDCIFVPDWLKTKGLHKQCFVFGF